MLSVSLCVSGLLTGAAKFNLSLPHLLQISPSVSTCTHSSSQHVSVMQLMFKLPLDHQTIPLF